MSPGTSRTRGRRFPRSSRARLKGGAKTPQGGRGVHRLSGKLSIPLLTGILLFSAGTARAGTGLSEFARTVMTSRWAAAPPGREAANDPRATLAWLLSERSLATLAPVHRTMLENLASTPRREGPPVMMCFSQDMPPDVVKAFEALLFPADKFRQGNRWSTTALSGGGLSQGDPTIITYSFAPDGTFIASGIGEAAAPSDLFAFLNGIYGSPAAWQAQFHAVFQAWAALIGITCVHEPNDDGADLFNNPGVAGVRGDVRIGGKFIDGESGANTLAYNYFPNNGDMVLDTANPSFFGNTSGNSLRLRNTVAHEHGHGLGMYHVCPVNQTKLMEPYVSTAYDGPRHDDILNGQRHYGDPDEDNDSWGTATPLGSLNNETRTVTLRSLDDNSDVDFYSFAVQAGKQVDVTVRPLGEQYLEGAQGSSCSPGILIDTQVLNDFGFQVLDQDGATVLASGNANPAGSPESVANVVLPSGAGDYFLHVFAGANDNVQLYEFDLTIEDSGGAAPTATASSTVTSTQTSTRTITRTSTRTATPSPTRTATPTLTLSPLPTHTETEVPKPTDEDTDTPTATVTETVTATVTETNTATATETVTHTSTMTASETATPTSSPSRTATATSSPSQSATGTATETYTPTPTHSPTHTATATPSPSLSSTQTATYSPSRTATPSPTVTRTETAIPTPSPTSTPTSSATPTPTSTASLTDTVTPSASATPTDTGTASATPTATEPDPTPTESSTPTEELKPTEESYDVAPLQLDGMVDSRDLGVWLERIASGTEEADLLIELSLFWMEPVE